MNFDCSASFSNYFLPTCDKEEHYGKITTLYVELENSTMTDYSSNDQWSANIASGAVRLVKECKGNYDGGSAQTGEGFGNQIQRLNGVTRTANVMTKYRRANVEFFNSLSFLKVKSFGLVTFGDTVLRVVEGAQPMFFTQDPITDPQTDIQQFQTQIVWSKKEMPKPFAVPVVFSTPLPATVATAATNVLTTSFEANWSAVAGAIGYVVQVSADNFATILQSVEVGQVITTTITGLTTATAYKYRVVAFSFNEDALASNVISFTTT